MGSIRAIRVLWLIVAAFVLQPQSAQAATKIALVIGNANYSAGGQLTNPPNDTKIVGASLRKAGFEVIEVGDTSLVQFRSALRTLRTKANGAEIAMIYYAGHGIEVKGKNWLIPVDAKLESEYDIQDEAVDIDRILEAMSGAKVRVAVLDACRNDPFAANWSRGTRGFTRGLAGVEVDDVLVIYAAAQGQVAEDGEGNNSSFATSLAARLLQADLPLQLLGGAIRDDVFAATGGKQRPFVSASMSGTPIYLMPKQAPAPIVAAQPVNAAVPPAALAVPPAPAVVQAAPSARSSTPQSDETRSSTVNQNMIAAQPKIETPGLSGAPRKLSLAEAAALNALDRAEYEAKMADWEAEQQRYSSIIRSNEEQAAAKKAAYEAEMARWQASVKAAEDEAARKKAEFEASTFDCGRGDGSRCVRAAK
jgi:uncharacterized caspase-like protein